MSTHPTFVPKTLLARTRCIILLILCHCAYGQTNGWPRAPQDANYGHDNGTQSDLAKENENQVAASSIQIREVLVKDAGLLVELKRWIAKEATDNGQVVRESNLSQEAIFERLDRDVTFRSVATRLLQRYGYLLPQPNPDSTLAKEQDFVLKERARQLVQIEAQEDSDALRPDKRDQPDRDVERAAQCDPQDRDCDKAVPHRRGSTSPVRNEPPNRNTDPGVLPDLPASPQRTLQTNLQTGTRDSAQLPSGVELASETMPSRVDPFSASQNPDSLSLENLTPRNESTSYPDRTKPRTSASRDELAESRSSYSKDSDRRPPASSSFERTRSDIVVNHQPEA